MSYATRETVAVTTAADGSATAYTGVVTGRIQTVIYVKDNFVNGVDFTITVEGTGEGVWTEDNVDASATVAPRQPTHDNVGAASLYVAGAEPVEDYIVVANDRIKIVIADGGNVTNGTFYVVMA